MNPSKERNVRSKRGTALKVLADLLPEERREQFYATAAKFKDLPEDDEMLAVLELMGFITVALDRVPKEMSRMLERSRSGLTDEQRDGLRDDFEAMFKKSVDTPSYKDLLELVRQMQVAHGKITREVQNLAEPLHRAGRPHKMMIFSNVSGLLLSVLNAVFLAFILTRNIDQAPVSDSDTLALFNSGRLTYTELETPEFGKVGVVRVEGEILDALEGEPTNRGYIFMRPISRYRDQE